MSVLEVSSRSVRLLGATTNPDGRWTTQQVRNPVMDLAIALRSPGSSCEIGRTGNGGDTAPATDSLSRPMLFGVSCWLALASNLRRFPNVIRCFRIFGLKIS